MRVKQHFGDDLKRQDLRDLGTRVQAAHRRHARGAVARGDRRIAAPPARRCKSHDPEALENARQMLRRPDHLSRDQLRGADRRRRADHSAPSGTSSAIRTSSASRPMLKQPVIFDGRNLYDPALMKALEFQLLLDRPAAGLNAGTLCDANSGNRRRRLYRLAYGRCAGRGRGPATLRSSTISRPASATR